MLSEVVVGRRSELSQQELSSCPKFSLVFDVSIPDLGVTFADCFSDFLVNSLLSMILLFLLRWLMELYCYKFVLLCPNDSSISYDLWFSLSVCS